MTDKAIMFSGYMCFFICILYEVTLIVCTATRTEFVCCRLDSYLSSHCRKKPNSGRCRREGLALQAVTNFFNSDTFWGSILLRYFHFRRSEFGGRGGGGSQSTQMNDHLDSTSLPGIRNAADVSACSAPKPDMLTCDDWIRMRHSERLTLFASHTFVSTFRSGNAF